MTTTLIDAQALLDEWPQRSPATDRFSAALAQVRGSTGYTDLAVLIRQALRCTDATRQEGEAAQVRQSTLRLPKDLFPADFDFGSFGLDANSAGSRLVLKASPWKPGWLPDAVDPLDELASTPTIRRRDEQVAADPFLTAADSEIANYRNQGQRAAVRSAMLLDHGDTLLVNLPTGTGKTLAMTTPALANEGQLTVVVVPTVALALDQARRLRELRPDYQPAASHSGLTKPVKNQFCKRIGSGQQEIVFTSPEAVVGRLAEPITKAAELGRLGLFAIDEVHVVLSWGDAFRPHFQALAGFRRHLHRTAKAAGHDPCKTILASATLTQDAVALLETLFGDPRPIIAVQAPSVRPEPTYWGLQGIQGDLRKEYLLEALHHLPRPAIVYTTLRTRQPHRPSCLTSRQLVGELKQQGFRRVVAIDGGSSSQAREEALKGLRDKRSEDDEPAALDLVVANSAFGLGIDIPDVRTVIHACLPEGLDRYYQELGRGGRDGRSSVSLLLSTKDDLKTAEGLASPRYLTSDLARKRWSAMWTSRERISVDFVRLPLSALHQDLRQDNDFNQEWNLFTLVLLVRCGAITWDFNIKLNERQGWITIQVLEAPGELDDENYWSEVVEPVRRQLTSNSSKNLKRLRSTLAGSKCTGTQIAESYRIREPRHLTITSGVACGGCMACRRIERRSFQDPSPWPPAIVPTQEVRGSLDDYAAERTYGRVLTLGLGGRASDLDAQQFRSLLELLRSQGLCQMFVSPQRLEGRVFAALAQRPPNEALMYEGLAEWDPDLSPGVRTAVFLDDHDDCRGDDLPWFQGHSRLPLIVCLTSDENPPVDGGYPIALLSD